MLSEEEKKAVIFLKHFLEDDDDVFKISNKDLRIILNLIENQQKELNNLKEIEKSHQEENGKLRVELEQEKEKNKELMQEYHKRVQEKLDLMYEGGSISETEVKRDYIPKDKIKKFFSERKLKYTEADDGIYNKEYLTRGELELVDRYKECNEIAELLLAEKIELPKECISKDKIKEKIEELEKELKEFQEQDFISEAAKRHQQIQFLNDILEI